MSKTIEEKRARWRQNAKSYYKQHRETVLEKHLKYRLTSPLSYTPKSLILGLTASNAGKILHMQRSEVIDKLAGVKLSMGIRYPLEVIREWAFTHELEMGLIEDIIMERDEYLKVKEEKTSPERRAVLSERLVKARAAIHRKTE